MCIKTRLEIWGLVSGYKLCKGKLFRAPLSSSQCRMSFCLTNGFWPSPVVPHVFLNNLLIFLVDCFIVWCVLPSATPVLQVKRIISISLHSISQRHKYLKHNKPMRLGWQKAGNLQVTSSTVLFSFGSDCCLDIAGPFAWPKNRQKMLWEECPSIIRLKLCDHQQRRAMWCHLTGLFVNSHYALQLRLKHLPLVHLP